MRVMDFYNKMVMLQEFRISWIDCNNGERHYPITKNLRRFNDIPTFLLEKEIFSFEADGDVMVMYISSQQFASLPYVDLEQMIIEDYRDGKSFEYILNKYKGGKSPRNITELLKDEMDDMADNYDY